MATHSFDFGVELEMLIRPKSDEFIELLKESGYSTKMLSSSPQTPLGDRRRQQIMRSNGNEDTLSPLEAKQEENRRILREVLAFVIQDEAGIPAQADETCGYLAWTVTDDCSIGEVPGYCKLPTFSLITRHG